ncbi:MAG: 1-deoxy-D-xylulose-5-phosphate reductoisomerase [Micavibrio aeruginosavorus]|uniref:1-deoxy-D-xylulose 5-phosphate reductoisomerase n=1 Tax=Micavibrio aeruginosavorus TaxID=349221 RepID=A0A2W5FMZ8_9BACT|nr:MAG: 1-deoxy-D-xylulose-5-phosphate reductoisomerase [Micavibrio aeruginosavorus]
MSCKTITVLGSTGSIGKSTLDLLKFHSDKFEVVALTANKNADLLIEQALQFNPKLVAIGDESLFQQVKSALSAHGVKVIAGEEGILEAASMPVDISIAAIVGMGGLRPLMASLGNAKTIAIANKEPLVSAGNLFLEAARQQQTKILPLDSEHNAIYQVFENKNRQEISNLILTASGGPFREWTAEQISNATPEQAVAHPNWSMGAKISVDSASMMNKGLEIIEAYHLFRMPSDKIKVIIHPQSIIHSMVEYTDGSVLAQLGAPDMRTPIAYALAWPERMETSGSKLDLAKLKTLEFETPDLIRFPCLQLAYEALESGAAACIALNASNEILVEAFLERKISFSSIPKIISSILPTSHTGGFETITDILSYDSEVRKQTRAFL